MWIARDKHGRLWLYEKKPKRLEEEGIFMPILPHHQKMMVSMYMLSGVTWENSPVRIKLVIDDEKVGSVQCE